MAFRLSRSESIPLLKQDMTITPVLIGLIGSALVLGAVLGATLGGIAADRIGRKRAFIADMAILVAGSALCAVARDPASILVGQFLIGVRIGIDFPTSGSYVSEIMPRAFSGRVTVATSALQSVGIVLAAITAIAIFRAHPTDTDWRLLMGTRGVLAAIYERRPAPSRESTLAGGKRRARQSRKGPLWPYK